ncbi:MAG: PfkB family carbohydrate kinase [Acidobacteria bacterium]|jgi:rfaE bifunctional protein kinase chain/domain|nr:PfkB family carbohydrate kinase [Acidobacteriota bacterium]
MQTSLSSIVSRFKNKKVAVWGDLILDQYVFTSAGRVSREAPVLVTEFEKNEYRLGGAGNVVMNLLTLGAQPLPVGFVGKDAPGGILLGLLREQGIATGHLVTADGFQTPLKSRILSGGDNTKKQQILRIDTLPPGPAGERARLKLVKALHAALAVSDLLVLSDYLAQAVIPGVFHAVRKKFPHTPSVADSRNNLLDFPGVTLATPNEPEIKSLFPGHKFLEEGDFLRAGSELLGRLDARGVVLKRGHRGMLVFGRGEKPSALGIFGTSQIVDVTGAGDTVLAVLGLGLASGASLLDSARLANIAGGIVVMHEGAYPVRRRELQNALR